MNTVYILKKKRKKGIITPQGVSTMFIDTHVHLNNPKLYKELDHYIAKAKAENVNVMIVIGYDHETNQKAIEIAEKYPFIYASIGYHPTIAKDILEKDFTLLEKLLKHPKVVAIGECGLDFYWDKHHVNEQISVFNKQIELSKQYQLPIVIHMRDATEKTYLTLKDNTPDKGIMHCYSGSKEMAIKFIDLGLHISLGGPVTFLNAKTPKEVAEVVPLDNLLIETDAPYLAPHPYRGKQNDSSYLPLIAQAIADIKGIPIETVALKTTENAVKLFNLKENE